MAETVRRIDEDKIGVTPDTPQEVVYDIPALERQLRVELSMRNSWQAKADVTARLIKYGDGI